MIRLTDILKEAKAKPVDFPTFLKWTKVTMGSNYTYDKNGDVIIDISLRTRPGAPFDYKYTQKKARLIDYVKDDKLRKPIQIAQTIYDKYYK